MIPYLVLLIINPLFPETMNAPSHKITSYCDFIKTMRSSKPFIPSKLNKEQKQNNQACTNRVISTKKKTPSLKTEQSITPGAGDYDKQRRKTVGSIQKRESHETTRFQTEFQSVCTNKNSASESREKSKEKGSNCESDNARVIPFYVNEIAMVIEEMPRFNHTKITYLDYLELLRSLNMIQSNYQPTHHDHVHEFWEVICTKDSTINLINFILLFLSCFNIHTTSTHILKLLQSPLRTPFSSPQNKKYKAESFRTDQLGYLSLLDQEVKEIYHRFKEFRTTRMFLGRIQKKGDLIEEKLNSYDSYTHQPAISERSIRLAEIRKEKEAKKLYQSQFQVQFTPEETIQEAMTSPKQSTLGMRRSEALYNLCKSKSKQKKDRRQDQVEFERNQTSYTFKPEINKRKVPACFTKKSTGSVSGELKTLERFLKGRVEKELRKKSFERGNTTNSKSIEKLRKKITSSLCEPVQRVERQHPIPSPPVQELTDVPRAAPSVEVIGSRQQIFNFEVYLQGSVYVDSIRVFEGDCIQTVAKLFTLKHNLKEEMEAKLIRSMKSNLESLKDKLDEIEEESVEYSF